MEETKRAKTTFAWLEITGKCQLECGHCYADAGPQGTHGPMQRADWLRVVDELAQAGVGLVCIIGGEPTLHPDLVAIVERVLARGMEVEVFTNLVRVSDEHWRLFERRGVSLATSFYSSDPEEHARIVGRSTHARTKANIEEARRRGIPIRAAMPRVLPAQRIEAAKRMLEGFGISRVRVDDLRGVGRAARTGTPDVSELCGKCASGKIAVTPDGVVYPCVLSRWCPVGNVLESPVTEILHGSALTEARGAIAAVVSPGDERINHAVPVASGGCFPDAGCTPNEDCGPSNGKPPAN